MKQVKCVNPKNYRLTVDNEYSVEDTNDDFYLVINDNGKQVRYSKDLFEDVILEDTIEQILERVSLNPNRVINSFSIDGNNITFNNTTLLGCFDNTHLSCGIGFITNINEAYNRIHTALIDYVNENRSDLVQQVFKKLFKLNVERINQPKLFYLSSTNTNYIHFEAIDSVLSQFTVSGITGHNPNSGNEIKLWVMTKESILNN